MATTAIYGIKSDDLNVDRENNVYKNLGRFPREIKVMHQSNQKSNFKNNDDVEIIAPAFAAKLSENAPLPLNGSFTSAMTNITSVSKGQDRAIRKEKRKVRKKKKFRLIPTFKHLENGRFIGRRKELWHIRTLFTAESLHQQNATNFNKLRVCCLLGTSGVGKSSLAYAYLHVYERKYKYVFWLTASSILSDARDILMYHLSGKEFKTESSAEIIRLRFLQFLCELNSSWLVILDDYNWETNAKSFVKIQDWVPRKMENISLKEQHKYPVGHILITTNYTKSRINRTFCNFAKLRYFDVDNLAQNEAEELMSKYSGKRFSNPSIGNKESNVVKTFDFNYQEDNKSRQFSTADAEREQISIEALLDCNHLNGEPLCMTLVANLCKMLNLKTQRRNQVSFNDLLTQYNTERDFLMRNRHDQLKDLYLAEQRLYSTSSEKQKQGRSLLSIFFSSEDKPATKILTRQDLGLFNCELYEMQLALRKFKLEKYFDLIMEMGIVSLKDLSRGNAWWKEIELLVQDKTSGFLHYDPKDDEKFEELRLYVRNLLTQEKVNVIIKIWRGCLQENLGEKVFNKALDILRQCSWLNENRIPILLFPDVLQNEDAIEENFDKNVNSEGHILQHLDDETNTRGSSSSSHASTASFSTITHNTHALSNFHLEKLENYVTGDEIPGLKSRYTEFDNDILKKPSVFAFLVQNNLIKLDRLGYFSMNKFVKNAVIFADSKSEAALNSISHVLSKVYSLGFEMCFEEFTGENLALLKTYPRLIENDAKLTDILTSVKILNNPDVQGLFSNDVNFQMNLLHHLTSIRGNLTEELSDNSVFKHSLGLLAKKINQNKKQGTDVFGVKESMNKYSSRILLEKNKATEMTVKDTEGPSLMNSRRFNGHRFPVFPEFATRSCELILADLLVIEGLLILTVPFRKTRFDDAFSCFKRAFDVYKFHERETPDKKDMVFPKCIYFMGKCVFGMGNYHESLKLFELSLKHFKQYYGEFTNHSDIARNLSSLACNYHELARVEKSNSSFYFTESLKYHDMSFYMFTDLFNIEAASEAKLRPKDNPDEILSLYNLNANFAKIKANKAKTLIEVGRFTDAENLLLDCFEAYSKLAEMQICYSRNLANVALLLTHLYCLTDDDDKRLLEFFNAALQAFNLLSHFEDRILKLKSADSENGAISVSIINANQLNALPSNLFVCEALRSLAEFMMTNRRKKESVILLETCLAKLRIIYKSFDHPLIEGTKSILASVAQ